MRTVSERVPRMTCSQDNAVDTSIPRWRYHVALDDDGAWDIDVSRESDGMYSWTRVGDMPLHHPDAICPCWSREQAVDAALDYIEQLCYVERHGADA
ncbi:MAG: hypothetical protein NVS2B16_20000 [Chloroflexota bacterium]